MHSPDMKNDSLRTLMQLTPRQVEQAWLWLEDPSLDPPPPELEGLSPLEWHLLGVVLGCLMAEKDLHLLQ